MKVAAYQAPLLKNETFEAIPYIKTQIERCENEGVEILCCPEAILGGLADDCQNPEKMALNIEKGHLDKHLAPLASKSVSLIIGFTEIDNQGQLFNTAAVLHKGNILGLYRKVYPAVNRSIYTAGDQLPVFTIGPLTFGIVICNDSNYIEPARVLAAKGASAIFIPLNNGLPPEKANVVTRARNTHIGRAVENGVTIIAADVAGHQHPFVSYGSSSIITPDGTIVAQSKELQEDLLIADIDTHTERKFRGWDASKNPAVVKTYLDECYADPPQ